MTRRSEAARAGILRAAARVLRREGGRGFSQPRVAEAAGLAQGHLTYYFPKRSDLLAAVVGWLGDRTGAEVRALAGAGGPAQRLELIGRLVGDRGRTRMWLTLLAEAEADPALRAALSANALRQLAAHAALLGRPCVDDDLELAFYTLWGLGVAHVLFGARRRERLDALLRRLLANLEAAAPTSARAAPPAPDAPAPEGRPASTGSRAAAPAPRPAAEPPATSRPRTAAEPRATAGPRAAAGGRP